MAMCCDVISVPCQYAAPHAAPDEDRVDIATPEKSNPAAQQFVFTI
jgi:hypothetical protein